MARDADGEVSGITGQSKRPHASRLDSSDQIPHHRVKSQKHIVGGGSRMHARVPSSKALHKHHGPTSTTKLNRRHGSSFSPERGSGLVLASNHHHHRRATSELKLVGNTSSTDLKNNTSQVSLKRNRSQADVGKKNKSLSNLNRSASNRAVDKLRHSRSSSKVHFNIGTDEEEDDDNEDEGEWVDASASASPLLSRRGSTISGTGQPADTPTKNQGPNLSTALSTFSASPQLPTSHRDDPTKDQSPPANGPSGLTRNASHNQYLTSRILSRASSHGAPPKMSTETALVRPASPRQPSLAPSSLGQSTLIRPGSSGGPELTSRFLGNNNSQGSSERPELTSHFLAGSSGKPELTSRFLGENGPEHGSDTARESFKRAANTSKSGFSRAAVNGKAEAVIPRRPRSMGSLSHQDPANRQPTGLESNGVPPTSEFVLPEDLNRTQQKLDLARESSAVEPADNPYARATAVIGVFNPDKAPQEQPAVVSRIVKRTGMLYDAVRMYQNPIARSIARVRQLPGVQQGQKIPAPSRMRSAFNMDGHDYHESAGTSSKRPVTPRSTFASIRGAGSAASSLGTEDDPGRIHDRQRFSGMDLTDEQDNSLEDTTALLAKMWDQRQDLSASQE